MRLLLWLATAVMASCLRSPHTDGPDHRDQRVQPVFEVGLWPGEGIPIVEAVGARVFLHAAAATSAKVIDTLVPQGSRRLYYDSTRFQTLVPAQLTIAAPTVITGRFLGRMRYLSREAYYSGAYRDTSIRLAPPATLEYLQDRAEGTCFVALNESVIDAHLCPTYDTISVRRSGQPVTSWWIHVNMHGRRGWVPISHSTARVIDRTF